MKVYRIRDWAKHFENNRTRELKKMDWVPVPNKHDGDGFTELLDHENGVAHYGAWHLILQVASKCDPRGTLLRDGAGGVKIPHTPQSLARITHGDAAVFEQAIARLITIGWVEVYDNPAPSCGAAAPSCVEVTMEWNGMEGNGMNGREGDGSEAPHPVFDFEKTIPKEAKYEDLYRDTMKALSGKLTTSYEQWLGNFHSKGLAPTKETVAAVNVSMLNRPGPDWGTYGNRILEFAIIDLCKTHGKKVAASASRQQQEICPGCAAPRAGRETCNNMECCESALKLHGWVMG